MHNDSLTRRQVIGLLGVTLATAAAPSRSAITPTPLRLGTLGVTPSNLYLYLGDQQGIYRRHGVDLRITQFLRGGPEQIAAAASGQLDVGSAGTPILTGISRGVPIKVVGSPPRKEQPFILVARPEIRSIADLKGKIVGSASVGGGGSQALAYILRAHGLSEKSVQSLPTGGSSTGYIALKSGRLSATICSELDAVRAEQEGVGKVLAQARDYFGRYQHSFVFATNRFIAQHPDTLRAYFRAHKEALLYARDHRSELLDLGRSRFGMTDKLMNAVLDKEIPKWDVTARVDREGLLNAIKIVQQVGDISRTYKPSFEQITDLRFI